MWSLPHFWLRNTGYSCLLLCIVNIQYKIESCECRWMCPNSHMMHSVSDNNVNCIWLLTRSPGENYLWYQIRIKHNGRITENAGVCHRKVPSLYEVSFFVDKYWVIISEVISTYVSLGSPEVFLQIRVMWKWFIRTCSHENHQGIKWDTRGSHARLLIWGSLRAQLWLLSSAIFTKQIKNTLWKR